MFRTIADPLVFESLTKRLAALTPDTPRRWGTLTAHEMLCHLSDATEMALCIRPRTRRVPLRNRPLIKALILWAPVRWPRGVPTNPRHDPRREGTRPTEFLADRKRLITALEQLAQPASRALEPAHGLFGRMTVADWQRWAYKHTDHHLRQFGL